MRRRLAVGVWGVVLLWTALALLLNLVPRFAPAELATRELDRRPIWLQRIDPAPLQRASAWPSTWLPGSDLAEHLRSELARIDRGLQDPISIAIASRHLPPHELHILRMWVAYLLPRHTILLADASGSSGCCAWVLHYPALAQGQTWTDPERSSLVPPASQRETRQRRRGRTYELLRTDHLSISRLGVPADTGSEIAGGGPQRAGGGIPATAWLFGLLLIVDSLGKVVYRGLLSVAGAGRPQTADLVGPVLWGPLGLVGWASILHIATIVGVSWSPGLLFLLGLLAIASRVVLDQRRPFRVPAPGSTTILWATAATLALVFAVPTIRMRTTLSDFIYHWGLKARWLADASGVDAERLSSAAATYSHPDYPLLWPITWASQAVLGGSWQEQLAFAWSPCLLLIIVWALLRLAPHGWHRLQGLPAALAATAFALGYYQGGSPDLAVSLAAALGCLGLVELRCPPAKQGPDQCKKHGEALMLISSAAALAAASKLEGMVLALLLLAALALELLRPHGLRCARKVRGLIAAVLPTATVLALWAATALPHGLIQQGNRGAFDLDALPEVLPALADAAGIPAWRGLPWLALLLFPLCLLRRSTRPAALVMLAQNLFYLWAYLATPFDRELLIITSYPRLLSQVVPTMLALGLLALAMRTGNDSQTGESAA